MNYGTELARLGAVGEPFNHADGWGFGGGIGTAYTLPDGSEFRQGHVNVRNGRPQRFARVVLPDGTDRHNAQALAYLQALPTPPELIEARLLAEARRLITPPREHYVQGNLFYDVL